MRDCVLKSEKKCRGAASTFPASNIKEEGPPKKEKINKKLKFKNFKFLCIILGSLDPKIGSQTQKNLKKKSEFFSQNSREWGKKIHKKTYLTRPILGP